MNKVFTTKEKIKKAALGEFAGHGLEGARVDRIARRAKVNKAMIYYHFKNKESLYESILAEVYTAIFPYLLANIPDDKGPEDKFDAIINSFVDFISELDQDYVKVVLRELAGDAKYFKKLMLPNVFVPMVDIAGRIFGDGVTQGIFKEVVPHLTFIFTLGSIIFSNVIRITLSDTAIGKEIFHDRFFDQYRQNLLAIVKTGILVREGKQ